MYACLYHPRKPGEPFRTVDLRNLVLQFSPALEQTSLDTVVFSIAPLLRFFGTPQHLASAISHYGFTRDLPAHLAIAPNIDTVILLARHYTGVTIALAGQEQDKLSGILIACLIHHDIPVDSSLLAILERWGVRTCGELAALPENGIAERLGQAGLYLRKLACGRVNRPLRLSGEVTKYEEQVQLEDAVDAVEPLLFLFGRVLNDLCGKLRSQSQAARQLHLQLHLEKAVHEAEAARAAQRSEFLCQLEFAVPLHDSRAILKLLQLELERNGPAAPVTGFALSLDPVDSRHIQEGSFLSPVPAADPLQTTLARIEGLPGNYRRY